MYSYLKNIRQVFSKKFNFIFDMIEQAQINQIKKQFAELESKEDLKVNSYENFMHFFDKMLEGLFIDRMEGNEEIFTKLMNDEKMMEVAAQQVGKDVYNRIRKV